LDAGGCGMPERNGVVPRSADMLLQHLPGMPASLLLVARSITFVGVAWNRRDVGIRALCSGFLLRSAASPLPSFLYSAAALVAYLSTAVLRAIWLFVLLRGCFRRAAFWRLTGWATLPHAVWYCRASGAVPSLPRPASFHPRAASTCGSSSRRLPLLRTFCASRPSCAWPFPRCAFFQHPTLLQTLQAPRRPLADNADRWFSRLLPCDASILSASAILASGVGSMPDASILPV